MTIRALLRRLDQFRRDHTKGLGTWFYRWLGQDPHLLSDRIASKDTRTILVLRDNKRIGNMYFMLPFLRELRRAYPQATIDLMVIDPKQAAIFQNLGLNRILASHFAFKTGGAFWRTMRQCRSTVYDLLLMPHASASDTVIGGLLHAKNKVAFDDETTRLVYPHSVDLPPTRPHAALTALTLIEALGHRVGEPPDHTMSLTPAEIEQGEATVRALRQSARHCFAYFRGARGNKVVADAQWRQIRERFDQATATPIRWIEILSPDVRTPLIPGTSTFGSADLRTLAAVLRAFDLFLCADTGPLHLADAAGARCVGLFTQTQTLHYGCLGVASVNVTHIDAINPPEIFRQLGLMPSPTGAVS